jgi:hypothetical protein
VAAYTSAIVLTSFKFGRSRLTSRQWKLLHKSGIYFLWAYAFSVYWYALFYYEQPDWIDFAYYWGGFLVVKARGLLQGFFFACTHEPG